MGRLKDSRVSYSFVEGREFWRLVRSLTKQLDELNKVYEVNGPPSYSTQFVFPDTEPLGYSGIRVDTLDAISNLTNFLVLMSCVVCSMVQKYWCNTNTNTIAILLQYAIPIL